MRKTIKYVSCFLFLFPSLVIASGAGITYNGRLLDPSGNAVVSSNVQFRIQIRTPGNENCLMYEEIQSKDMTNSDGVFSITINDGTGSRTDSSGFTLDQLFANRGTFSFPAGYCVSGTSYNTNSSDGRKLQVYFNDGSFATGQWEPTPSMAINFIPMAIESQQVGGYKKEQLLKIADGVSTTGTELDATKWTSLQALINGTSTVYTKPTDQVTQLYGATVPTPANGQSIRWNSALNAGAGGWENFTAGSASAVTTVSSANTDISVANGSTTPTLTLNSGTSANQIVKLDGTAKLPAVDGSALTNVNASKVGGTTVSLASLTNGQVLKYNGTNWANASDADTLGGLSCANGRVAYYSGSAWACLEVASVNTVNTIVSRDASGISNFGTVDTGTLKINDGSTGAISLITPVAVTSYTMRLPTSVGSAGQVLTTDGNSPAQLSWASASSQWTTSASNIYYNTGNVGIGTTSPGSALTVAGTASIGIPSSFDYASPRFSVTSGCNGCGGNFIGQSINVSGPTTTLQGLNISAVQPVNGGAGAGPLTTYGINNNVSSVKQITSGASTLYGSYTSASSTGATGGTINTYGGYITASGDTGGTSTATGLYVSVGGASTNYAGIFMGGNVGIGTTSPGGKLSVSSSASLGTDLNIINTDTGGRNYGFISSGSASEGGAGKFHIYDWSTPRSMMTFDSSGNVEIGGYLTSDGPSSGFIIGDRANTNISLLYRDGNKTKIYDGTLGDQFTIDNSTGNVGIGTVSPDQLLSVNGDASKVGGGSWQTFSDARLKTVNGDFTRGLNDVLKLQPISYHYNDRNPAGIPNDGDHIGFVAQDVEKVIPEAISKSKKGYLMVNNDPIIWTMFNAIKDLYYKLVTQDSTIGDIQKENEALKSKVQDLENQNQSIKAYLCEKDPNASLCH